MNAETLCVSLDGITLLPPGHAATIKSYLERTAPPSGPVPEAPAGFALARLTGTDEARYLAIFATLGTRWLWWSRLMLTPQARAAILDDPDVEAYAVTRDGMDCGLVELDLRDPAAPDLAFLGLYDHTTGKGVGSWLIGMALARLWRDAPGKVTVNTCTFDSPAALGFYRRHGFEIVKQAIEIVPDPRLAGLLPRDAAPHVPLLP